VADLVLEVSKPLCDDYASEGSMREEDQPDDPDVFDGLCSDNVHEQMEFSLISEAEEQCGLLYQLKIQHKL